MNIGLVIDLEEAPEPMKIQQPEPQRLILTHFTLSTPLRWGIGLGALLLSAAGSAAYLLELQPGINAWMESHSDLLLNIGFVITGIVLLLISQMEDRFGQGTYTRTLVFGKGIHLPLEQIPLEQIHSITPIRTDRGPALELGRSSGGYFSIGGFENSRARDQVLGLIEKILTDTVDGFELKAEAFREEQEREAAFAEAAAGKIAGFTEEHLSWISKGLFLGGALPILMFWPEEQDGSSWQYFQFSVLMLWLCFIFASSSILINSLRKRHQLPPRPVSKTVFALGVILTGAALFYDIWDYRDGLREAQRRAVPQQTFELTPAMQQGIDALLQLEAEEKSNEP